MKVGGQSPTKMASRSARAFESLSETLADRPQSETEARIDVSPALCKCVLVSPSFLSIRAIFI
jgi:hypothetical protein